MEFITKEQVKQIKQLLVQGKKSANKLDSIEYNLLVRINELKLEQIKLKNRPDSDCDSFSEYYYIHNEGVLYGLEYALKILRAN